MPSIPEYFAREDKLNPSSTGSSAFEQSGRRLGPLFNEAAQFKVREGNLAAQAYKQKMWPFDILRLYQIQASEAAKDSGGTSFRVANRPGATGNASDFDVPRYLTDGWTPGYDGVDQVSRGASALGNALRDGGYSVAQPQGRPKQPAPDGPSGGGGGGDYSLFQGEFVSGADQRKLDQQYRADRDTSVRNTTNDLVNVKDYWSQYYGAGNPGGAYDPNTNQPVSVGSGPIPPPIPDQPSSGGFPFYGIFD
jgi:hypothetical protein